MKFFITAVAAVLSLASITEANVDISGFDKLYIRYHNCAWSAYNGDCGADGNGGDLWYLGLTECFRANAAYSLYGVPKGADDKGCTKGTYLNSFFSTGGVDAFVETLENAGVYVNQQGEQQGDDENQEEQAEINGECQAVEAENQDGDQGDDYDWTANNRKMFDGTTSVGVGCAGSQFAVKTYGGAYCDERAAIAVTDELTDFNEGLEAAECVVIYDGTGQNDDANDGNQAEEELELFQNSEACNVRFYPKSCPDPYGKLSFEARSTARNVAVMTSPVGERVKMAFSWLFLSIGTIFMGASAWACWNKSNSSAKLDLTDDVTSVKSSRSGGWLSKKKNNNKSNSSSSSGQQSSGTRKRRCIKWNPFRKNRNSS